MHFLAHFLATAGVVTLSLLLGAFLLHWVPRRVSEAFCRAPALDLLVTYFVVAPLVVGPIICGWAGFAGAIAGQVAAVQLWIAAHEWVHREAARGPRIVKVVNRLVGRWRNHAALWITATVTPLFCLVRMVEILAYPPLPWLVGFPKYKQREWVNVSRHKFRGLVGHDLIWCLYCDWMTGVWSLGSEMLRNVESFWCPIRFANDRKCENCAVDFPDLREAWVEAGGSMAEVANLVEEMHSNGDHSWFGSRVQVTVRGKEPEPATSP